MLFANCHFHSIFSDGVYTPEQLVELAKQIGHKALILTDHDTMRGCYFLQKAAHKAGMLTLTGCEFTTQWGDTGFHLVGVDFNPENENLRRLIAHGAAKQTKRTEYMFHYGQEQGTLRKGVTWKEVAEAFPDNDYLCNNQVFAVMLKKGIYRPEEYPDFIKYNFSYRLPINERMEQITGCRTLELEEVVEGIRKAGGIPVIAHPCRQQEYVKELLKIGVMGFETRHPSMTPEECDFFDRICDEYGLYKSGGTDHSSLMGGNEKVMPRHNLPPECGYVTEADFMAMYRREKG